VAGTSSTAQPTGPAPGSIAAIVAQFKSIAAKRVNRERNTPGASVWQRSFHDHVIRDEPELDRVRRCIMENPARWDVDRENRRAANSAHDGGQRGS